jgi:hypothetical protein
LSFAKYTGILSLLSALIYQIVLWIRPWKLPYEPVLVMILFMGGLNLIAMSILGSYIGKIFFESKKRPIYIAREVLSNDKKSEK